MPTIRIDEPDGSQSFHVTHGHEFNMPKLDAADALSPIVGHFDAAIAALGLEIDHIHKTREDQTLSRLGQDIKVLPAQDRIAANLAQRYGAVADEEAALNAREVALSAVPSIDPTHSAMAVEDREIRDFVRSLSIKERTDLLTRIDNEPGHERVMLALLRSPMGLNQDAEFVRKVWNRTRRLANPTEAMSIDAGRRNVEWAKRGLVTAGAVAGVITKWDKTEMLRKLLANTNPVVQKGYGVFGFTEMDAAREQRNVFARAGKRIP